MSEPVGHVVVCAREPEIAERVLEATGVAPVTAELGRVVVADARDLTDVQAVVIGFDPDEDIRALQLHQASLLHERGVPVVAVSGAASRVALAALRAGVVDVLDPDASAQQYRQALARAEVSRAPVATPAWATPEQVTAGRVVVVASPKGGAGKTTVACNLALGLVSRAPEQVALVDLDAQFGDVLTALNLDAEYRLPEMAGALDGLTLKTLLARHGSGLAVIGASEHPADAAAVTGEAVGRMLALLAQSFQFVVVDTAAALDDLTLAAVEAATDVVLVSTLDVMGVRALRREVAVLTELGLASSPTQIVLNRCDPRLGVGYADAEAAVGRPVDIKIPVSKLAMHAANQGTPLLTSAPRDPASTAIRGLVDRFLPAPQGRQRRKKQKRTPR